MEKVLWWTFVCFLTAFGSYVIYLWILQLPKDIKEIKRLLEQLKKK